MMRQVSTAAFAGFCAVFAACGNMRDRALVALAEAAPYATAATDRFQRQCVAAYGGAATREAVAELDALCLPQRRALADYREAVWELDEALNGGASEATLRGCIVRLEARAARLR